MGNRTIFTGEGVTSRPARRPTARLRGSVRGFRIHAGRLVSIGAVFTLVVTLFALVAFVFSLTSTAALAYFVAALVILTAPAWVPFLVVRVAVFLLDRQ